MGTGLIIISSILFGIIIGMGAVVCYFFIRTYIQNKNVMKINPNIVKEIELNKKQTKKTQDERNRRVKEIRERNKREEERFDNEGSTGDNTELGQPSEHITDEDSTSERGGIQIPKTSFNLRD